MGKGEETRAKILDQALAMATRVGLSGLSIGALAKSTGMSKSGLFAHFESKEGLQHQILDRAAEVFVRKVVEPARMVPRGEPRLRVMFEAWFGWEKSPGGCIFVTASTELDDQPGSLRDHLAALQQKWVESLARSARIAVEEGHFRPDLDITQFAFDAYAVILGYYHFKRLLRDADAEARARGAFDSLIENARA